jgi:hypothetical protein
VLGALAFFLFHPWPVAAGVGERVPHLRSDELLLRCTGRSHAAEALQAVDEMLCHEYIRGFIDSYVVTVAVHRVTDLHICMPEVGLTNEQSMRVVVKWLTDHPNRLHESARTSVFLALHEAFPCKGQ